MWLMGGKDVSAKSEVFSLGDDVQSNFTGNLPATVYNHCSLVFNDKLWKITETLNSVKTNRIFYSTNGVDWITVSTDVQSSTDGVN